MLNNNEGEVTNEAERSSSWLKFFADAQIEHASLPTHVDHLNKDVLPLKGIVIFTSTASQAARLAHRTTCQKDEILQSAHAESWDFATIRRR